MMRTKPTRVCVGYSLFNYQKTMSILGSEQGKRARGHAGGI